MQVDFPCIVYSLSICGMRNVALTEAELLVFHLDLASLMWTIIFAWVGTTTGMVAAAYFTAHRFSVALVSGMLTMYLLFTVACVIQLARMWQRVEAIGRDLVAIADAGGSLGESSQLLIRNIESEMVRSTVLPLIVAIFVVSCTYVVLCYRAGRKVESGR